MINGEQQLQPSWHMAMASLRTVRVMGRGTSSQWKHHTLPQSGVTG